MNSPVRVALCVTIVICTTRSAGARESLPDWSAGVGFGLLGMSGIGGLYFPAGFVSVERKLAEELTVESVAAGHWDVRDADSTDTYSAVLQLAVGPRYYLVANQIVRPSVFAHASGSVLSFDAPGLTETTSMSYGADAGGGLDADISEAVVLRLESPFAWVQRTKVFDDEDVAFTDFALGWAPRAQLRIGW